MIRRPPRSTLSSSSAASDVYKRQVSTQSTGALSSPMSASQNRKPRPERERESTAATVYRKSKAAVVVGLGVFMIFKAELIRVILDEPSVDRVVLGLGFMGWGAFAAIGLYMTQLSGLKSPRDWEKQYPSAIPTATACAVAGFFLIVAGLWPYYKFWSLFMLLCFCFCCLEFLSLVS
eukprot:TRINITY_DN12248_c0_g1_i1.p1 TRINITY_DN12248_c0_g1~~TRINITY_DN12248_c0_g1_i1.p1  ORF type:complete len:177 (-),score=21.64 TRINITY_DN12248_c0_g1_i1:280-810(-)